MSADAPALVEVDAAVAGVAAVAIAACLAATAFLVRRVRRGLPLVPSRPHRPVPWDGSDVLVITLGFVLLANVVGGLTGPKPDVDLALVGQLVLFSTASLLAVTWLVARGATVIDIGLAPVRPREDTAIAIVALAAVLAPLLLLNAWLTTIEPYEHPVIELLTSRRDAWGIGLVVATACFVAPVSEELFFRRILQGWLEKAIPTPNGLAAIGIASLAFAAAHVGQGLGYIPLFPLSVVLGLLARHTGSIVPSILLHALFNAVSVSLLLAGTGSG